MRVHEAQVRSEEHTSARASDRPRAAGAGKVDVDVRILDRLARQIGEEPIRRYFPAMARLKVTDGTVVITVATPFLAGLIDRRLGPAMREASGQVLGGAPELRFEVDAAAFPTASAGAGEPAPAAVSAGRPAAPARRRSAEATVSRYRFETFLPIPANALALQAAQSVASGDGRFSPLFLHGPCGMGKTHLLQALASSFKAARRGARVRCLTAEAFTNEFIASMHAGKLDEFRRSYRQVDLLCIDDVHFLSNKKATQAELLHTFDAIDLHGKLVALASDEHPREIARLNAALASRFMSGPVVAIAPLDVAQAMTLVVAFAERRNMEFDQAGLTLMQRRCEALLAVGGLSVRALEGELTQIEAMARLLPQVGAAGRLSGMHVARALGQSSGPGSEGSVRTGRPRRPVRMDLIVERVCLELGVQLDDLTGRGRHKRVVLARAVCVLLAREFTNLSFPEIAKALGRPNHSTVITALKRVQGQLASPAEAERLLGADVPAGGIVGLVGRLRSELMRAAG